MRVFLKGGQGWQCSKAKGETNLQGILLSAHRRLFLRPMLLLQRRSLLNINDWGLRKLDLKQSFIQADLGFKVFMKRPDGCREKSGRVLKQEGRG